jgi:Leucine-rich repeat (LRR) protein
MWCVESDIKKIKFTPNLKLTTFQASGCYFNIEDIKNYKNLRILELEETVGDTISIVGLHKLTRINVKHHENRSWEKVVLLADKIPSYESYLKSDEFKVLNSYTGKAADCKVKVEWNSVNPSQLDENLRKALEEKIGGTLLGSTSSTRKLTTLDVSGRKIKSLKYLDAFCPLLNTLIVDNNRLSELDLSGFNDLMEVSASNNVISYVDVADGNVITELNVSNNQIPSLPTQKLSKLRTLNCANNYIEELYGNHLKELSYLNCSNNMLTELILDQTVVKEVDCSNNKLSVFKLPNRKNLLEKLSANNCFGDDVKLKFDFTQYSNLREVSMADNAGLTELKIPTHNRLKSVVARNCNLQGTFSFSPGFRTTEIYPFIETIDMSNNPNLKVIVNSPYFGLNFVKNVNFTGCDVISVVIGGLPPYASGLQVRVGVPQRESGSKVKIQFTDGGVDWFERWEEWRKYPENQHTVVAFTMVDGVAKYYDSQSLTLENINSQDKAMRKDFGEKLYASLLKEKNKGKALEEQSRVFKVEDAKALTELNAANMNIKDLTRVLRWMPNLTTIDASGNDIATLNLQNQMIDNKAVYPLKNVTSLNLSNNSELNTLMMQPISMLELSNTKLTTGPFNHVLQRVTNKLTINNPGGIVTAYAIDGNSKAKVKVLHYGNTSKPLNVSYCDLDTLIINNATLGFSNLTSNAKNISIDNIVVKGQNAVVSTGNQKRINGEMVSVELNTPIAKNVTFENAVMGGSSLNDWIALTTDQLCFKGCTATSDLTITAEGAKKLTLEKMNANVKVSSCDFSQLTLDNASIILGGENTSQINIDQFRVSGNSTIYFQTADMMLMWLYNWKDQNPGQDVNVRVSAMTPEKESLALLANTFIGSGQLDLNNMSQVEIIKALNYLVEQGYIPKGDRYDNLINKLTKGEPLVEPTTEEDRLMRSDFGEKLYNSLLSNKNKGRAVKSDVLHVEDVKPLTKLNAANMGIIDLTRMLRWMPNLTDVNASGNNIETINLQNQMLEGRAVYPLQNVTSLNLSYNSKLSSLAMQSVNNVNLTGTAVNTKTFSHVVQRTKNKLVISSPVKAVTDSYTLDCSTKPLKVLYYVNTSHNMNITSCNLDTLVANSARITLGGSSTTGIEIKNMKVNSSTTINFQSADMMLMWLLGWQKQNVGVTVTYKVTAMTSAQQSIATNCNTYLGTINLNNMSQTEILNVINTLIGTYGLPKGDRYDNVMSKINNGEKLVEYSVATLPTTRSKGQTTTSGAGSTTTRILTR